MDHPLRQTQFIQKSFANQSPPLQMSCFLSKSLLVSQIIKTNSSSKQGGAETMLIQVLVLMELRNSSLISLLFVGLVQETRNEKDEKVHS